MRHDQIYTKQSIVRPSAESLPGLSGGLATAGLCAHTIRPDCQHPSLRRSLDSLIVVGIDGEVCSALQRRACVSSRRNYGSRITCKRHSLHNSATDQALEPPDALGRTLAW